MIYEIYCDGKLIAKFQHEHDRDICIEALREEHDDCNWTTGKALVKVFERKTEK